MSKPRSQSSGPLRLRVPWDSSFLIDDRFSLLDQGDRVLYWDVIKHLLSRPASSIHDIRDILETIHEYLERPSPSDFRFLESFLSEYGGARFLTTWRGAIVPAALAAIELFPSSESLPVLQSGEAASVTFSQQQIACLLAHQFLCSFPIPDWYPDDRSPDFHIWYSEPQPHAGAVAAYLRSFCEFFDTSNARDGHTATYRRLSLPDFSLEEFLKSNSPLCEVQIKVLDEASTDPAHLGLPNGACVISANKDIGFGRSGTQEEVNVGASPAACPAVLLTPTLRPDEVIVIEGARAHVSISGYGRQARLERTIGSSETCDWEHRTMLFMDALELDAFDGTTVVPDLLPGHLERELRKAFTAFSSSTKERVYQEVVTGLWGCRSFCGDPQIKTLVQWVAASLAGVPKLTFVVTKASLPFVDELERLVERIKRKKTTAGGVLRVLVESKADDHQRNRSAFAQT